MRNQIMKVLPMILSLVINTGAAQEKESQVTANREAEANLEKKHFIVVESGLSTEEEASAIQVYNHRTGKTMTLSMNEYLQGVVRGEMQATYPMEALKAQAVAARTYAYYLTAAGKEHPGGASVCTSHNCCQAWTQVDSTWEYYDKIREAVEETQGVVVTYEGEPILAMYFSASGGYTEDYQDVWAGKPLVYLQSVPSRNEQAYNFTENIFVQEFSSWAVLSSLREAGYEIACDSSQLIDSIKNVVRSDTGRVTSMEIGGVQISGTEIRECLGLRSTHFYLQKLSDGGIGIVTVGFGHGVGMSQCGSAALAEEGYNFKEILQYYYTGVEVEWMPFR